MVIEIGFGDCHNHFPPLPGQKIVKDSKCVGLQRLQFKTALKQIIILMKVFLKGSNKLALVRERAETTIRDTTKSAVY